MSRQTLAQQLAELSADRPKTVDPENAYSNLDSLNIPERIGDEGREHYLDVGPSRLRQGRGAMADVGNGGKYGGEVRGRVKIFDDESEEGSGTEDEGESGDDDEDEEDGDEDEEDEDDEEEDDDEEEEEEEQDEEDEGAQDIQETRPAPPSRIDPMAALRDSRVKDIEKGRGIKRQRVSASRYTSDCRRYSRTC
jgi:protein AATF/BFR2